MNKVVQEILEQGFDLVVRSQYGMVTYTFINEFYKSGQCMLVVLGDEVEAHTRYDQVTKITCFDDLVQLNFEWWQKSKDRNVGWAQPGVLWQKHFIRLGLATPTTETKEVWA